MFGYTITSRVEELIERAERRVTARRSLEATVLRAVCQGHRMSLTSALEAPFARHRKGGQNGPGPDHFMW
jgi:hypothetical protein